jgi:hypothetical protein
VVAYRVCRRSSASLGLSNQRYDGPWRPCVGRSRRTGISSQISAHRAISLSGWRTPPFELAWLTRLFAPLCFHPQRHTLASCSCQSFRIPIKVNLLKALFSWKFSLGGGSSEADRARCAPQGSKSHSKARLTIKDGRWRYHTTPSEDTKSGQYAVDIRQCSRLRCVALWLANKQYSRLTQ